MASHRRLYCPPTVLTAQPEQLIGFMKDNHIPLGGREQAGWHKVLIVGAEPLFIDRLRELLPQADDYRFAIADTGLQAGTLASRGGADESVAKVSRSTRTAGGSCPA